jgi:serine/threonine-protein kinase RsbW
VEHNDDGDAIRLTVPARSHAVRIIRVSTAGLGTKLGFSFTEVEDLRLAVGEAAGQLCDGEVDTNLEVTYHVEPDGLRVTLALHAANGTPATLTSFSDLASSILDDMVDDWVLDRDDARLVLRKTPADHHDD